MQSEPVPTEVVDLAAMKLRDLVTGEPDAKTLARLLARVEQPSRSISGYNPQRLD